MRRILLLFIIMISTFSYGQSDCTSALSVCGNSGISYTPTDSGNVQEDLGGCMSSDEHFSVWYTFTIAEGGTLAFMINPEQNIDYDWAVYGPDVNCADFGNSVDSSGNITPIRCNYSGIPGQTGLDLNLIFPATNGPFSGFMNVNAGETYYLVIDNYSASTAGEVNFTLDWSGTATLVSAFDDPSIQPNPFVPPGEAQNGELTICSSPELFDFSTLSNGIINGNPNFTVTYHLNANDALLAQNPITTPINVTQGVTYFYTISYMDPNDPNSTLNDCNQTGEITFVQGNIVTNNATLTACNNNNAGVGLYNLNDAVVFAGPNNITQQYYPTMTDLQNGTNEIQNPQLYESAEGTVFVKVTTDAGCTNTAEITLQFLPNITVDDKSLSACFIPSEPSTALFDLTSVEITQQGGVNLEYYASEQDAIDGNNPIPDPAAFISVSTDIYVKIISQSGCFNIVKMMLTVTPPSYSEVLKDEIVCVENVAKLDAGSGFDAYLWSTGADTSFINNVTVGTYWVDLTKNGCVTRQEVKVIASPVPVITDIKIKDNTLEVIVAGGTQPYEYSLDGVAWQESNFFEGLPRGQNFVYVRDSYNCEPVVLEVTMPNLINVITPNGDGLNDELDYSALSYKKDLNFAIYDRYGNKIFQNSEKNQYKWDGTVNGGKLVPTGTYWYVITWKNPVTGTPFTYKGWIMVKNR